MSVLLVISQVVYSLIFIVGLVGNLTIVYTLITTFRNKRRTSSYGGSPLTLRCLLHMSVSDIIFSFSMPLLISGLSPRGWPFGKFLCRYYLGLVTLPQFAKSFILTILGVICYAIHDGSAYAMTDGRVSVMLSGAWILSFVISLFIFAFASPSTGRNGCNIFWAEHIFASDAFILVYAICVFILPLGVAYVLGRRRHENPFQEEDTSLVRNTMNDIFSLTAGHGVLLFPYLVGQLILNFYKTAPGFLPPWKVNFALISGWIWWSSVALFPFLYCHINEDLKDAVKETISNIGKLRVDYTSLKPRSVFKGRVTPTSVYTPTTRPNLPTTTSIA